MVGQTEEGTAGLQGGTMPLAGVKVLEFSGLGPTPFGAMLLSDLGADVLRIERAGAVNALGGDPRFDFIFRGRPSVAFDLKAAADLEKVRQLVARADVLIEGFRPGTMERLGLGPDEVLRSNERLIFARMSGWGQTRPLCQKAGHDINYLALSGGLFPIGPFGGPPVPPLNFVGNFGGGGTFLAMGVMAALYERMASGKGQVIDVAMIDGISVLMTQLAGWMRMGQWKSQRGGNLLDGSAYFYRCYQTVDDRHIAVGALEKPFHDEFLRGLGEDPDEFTDYLDPKHWAERSERLARIIETRSMRQWEAAFADRDACVTPVLSLVEAASSKANLARGSLISSGTSIQPRPAPRFGRSKSRMPTETVSAQKNLDPVTSWLKLS